MSKLEYSGRCQTGTKIVQDFGYSVCRPLLYIFTALFKTLAVQTIPTGVIPLIYSFLLNNMVFLLSVTFVGSRFRMPCTCLAVQGNCLGHQKNQLVCER